MDAVTVARTASDTADPSAGLRAVAALRRLTDSLELAQVEAALDAGLTWTQISELLGVTRQAVHKKYAKRVDPRLARRARRRT